MADEESFSEWLQRVGPGDFTVEDEELKFSGNGDARMPSSSPPTGTTVRVGPSNGDITLYLNGTTISQVIVDVRHALTCRGTGTINRMKVDGAVLLFADSELTIEQLDITSAGALTLRTQSGARIERLIVGRHLLEAQLEEDIGETHVVGGEFAAQGAQLLTRRLSVDVPVLAIKSGKVRVLEASHRDFRLSGGTELQLTDDTFPSITAEMSNATLVVSGDSTSAETLTVRGTGAKLRVHDARVIGLTIEAEDASLALYGAEVIEVAGQFALESSGSDIAAAADRGLALTRLDVVDGSVDGIDFFELNPSLVTALAKARRVSGSWPKDRHTLMQRGRSIDAGVRSPGSRPAARAHHWSAVERLLRDKNAGGEDLVAAHRLAQDARRLAAPKWSHERILLEISRWTSYGTQLFWPIGVWLAVAIFAAVLVRALTTGISWGSGWERGFLLAWEIFVSPFTWVRPLNEGSTLGALTSDHLLATVFAFVARIVGTYAIASSALAARRYLRNP